MTDPTNRGWSAPFSDWVVEGWRQHSLALGGPEVAARMRETLSDPVAAKARAQETENKTRAALTKLTPEEQALLGLHAKKGKHT